jgi:UDP-N-acetylglucosamine/UDP-N-acetylgalactosamine diphosphorylase
MEFGDLLYQGVLDKLALARKERTSRLIALTENVPATHEKCGCAASSEKRNCELHDNVRSVCEISDANIQDRKEAELRDRFLGTFEKYRRELDVDYIQTIKAMPAGVSQEGVRWLQYIIDAFCQRAGALLPSFGLFEGFAFDHAID